MSTGQSILDRMELFFPELQLQTGENDVARGLIAVNMAQDYMESVFALHPNIFGSTVGTVVTVANTESTTYPAGVIRLDKLQYLDPSTSRPRWDVDLIETAGDHAPSADIFAAGSGTGAPNRAYANGRLLYWDPLPDAVYTVRWYGLQQQTDVTAAGAFLYPDICLTPIANLAVRFIRTGLDDATEAYQTFAQELFEPVVQALSGFRRDGPASFVYTQRHDT